MSIPNASSASATGVQPVSRPSSSHDEPLLAVEDLVVEIPTRRGLLRPVDGVSFELNAGEILGVVGESGAGKSITGAAIIGLLERPARIASGSVRLAGKRIDNLTGDDLRRVRGGEIGTVFQDPSTSLNPLQRIGDQLAETARQHLDISRAESRDRALLALQEVGIPAAAERLDAYPHEFSGGMRQRVVIALALIGEPVLVIADEPTTALDVSVQAQVLTLLKRLCLERGTGVMMITHDMGVIAETTDRVAVMYAGRVAEIGPTPSVLVNAAHPYTRGLMASTPNPASDVAEGLVQIPGAMPGLLSIPAGCAFHPRCDRAVPDCKQKRPPRETINDSDVWCWVASQPQQARHD